MWMVIIILIVIWISLSWGISLSIWRIIIRVNNNSSNKCNNNKGISIFWTILYSMKLRGKIRAIKIKSCLMLILLLIRRIMMIIYKKQSKNNNNLKISNKSRLTSSFLLRKSLKNLNRNRNNYKSSNLLLLNSSSKSKVVISCLRRAI